MVTPGQSWEWETARTGLFPGPCVCVCSLTRASSPLGPPRYGPWPRGGSSSRPPLVSPCLPKTVSARLSGAPLALRRLAALGLEGSGLRAPLEIPSWEHLTEQSPAQARIPLRVKGNQPVSLEQPKALRPGQFHIPSWPSPWPVWLSPHTPSLPREPRLLPGCLPCSSQLQCGWKCRP